MNPRLRATYLETIREHTDQLEPQTAVEIGIPGKLPPVVDDLDVTTTTTVDVDPTRDPDLIADARTLPIATASTELALCLNVLEHVTDFWWANQELHRILAPGGLYVVAVPGYTSHRQISLGRIPGLRGSATLTYGVHRCPIDAYRWGKDGVEALLDGLERTTIQTHGTLTPRFLALGYQPSHPTR